MVNKLKNVNQLVARDGVRCHYCGCELNFTDQQHPQYRTIDHIAPQLMGKTPSHELDNLVLSCYACNQRKNDRTYEEFKAVRIYVDDLRFYALDSALRGWWCHMWTNGNNADLKAFAISIGLKESWIQTQNPHFHHYDLRQNKRKLALAHGAVYMPLREWVQLMKR